MVANTAGKERVNEVTDFHRIDLSILLGERLQTNAEKGLSSKEHTRRLEQNGPNRMSPPKSIPEWLKILKNMTGFFSLLLLGGGVLCFIGYGLKKENRKPVSWNRSCSRCYSHRPFYLFSGEEIK